LGQRSMGSPQPVRDGPSHPEGFPMYRPTFALPLLSILAAACGSSSAPSTSPETPVFAPPGSGRDDPVPSNQPCSSSPVPSVATEGIRPGGSSIGLITSNTPGLTFSRLLVNAGAGGGGRDGAATMQLTNGPDAAGAAGQASERCWFNCAANPSQTYPDPKRSP